ncbi:MAG: HAD-IA family hydrolase [Acidimicrobiia bacterium]
MAEIKTLFWDVGGVLLTNGWDRRSRHSAMEKFGLDWEEFQDRHEFVSADFEIGKLTLDEYLERTVFYRDRPFTREDFVGFMEAQSEAYPESLALLERLASSGEYLLATLNNESRELNEFRIERFGLRDHFSLFLSSCYLGMRKPEEGMYRLAVDITQSRPDQCVFIDDRSLNLECSWLIGIGSVHFQDVEQLRTALAGYGVEA